MLVVPLIAAAFASFGLVGADARWLAAVGSAIANGHLVHSLAFATAPTSGWPNVPVLGELLFHFFWAAGGDRGLVFGQTVAVLIGFGSLALGLRREARESSAGLAGAGVVFLVLLGSLPAVVVARNQLFSLALFPVLLSLLEREARTPSRRLWLAVPLLVLWTNLHGAVLVGFALLAVYILLSRRSGLPVLVAAAIGLCVTPELWNTPRYYAAVSGNEAARLGEGLWAPLGLTVFDGLFVLAAIALAGTALRSRERQWRSWEAVAAIGLAASSIHAARLGTWLLFLLAYPAARSLQARNVNGVPVLVLGALALIAAAGLARTPPDPGSRTLAKEAARTGLPVLADPVPAEQVVVLGGKIWVGDPLEAFRHRDQRLYLDWAAGRASGRAAVVHARLVLVRRDSAAARVAVRDPRLVLLRRDHGAALYRVR